MKIKHRGVNFHARATDVREGHRFDACLQLASGTADRHLHPPSIGIHGHSIVGEAIAEPLSRAQPADGRRVISKSRNLGQDLLAQCCERIELLGKRGMLQQDERTWIAQVGEPRDLSQANVELPL